MKARALLAAVFAGLLAAGSGSAQDSRQTQRQLDKVKRELRQVGNERRRLEGERGQANRALREADEQVNVSTRSLARTNARIQQQQAQLQQLQQQRATLEQHLDERREELKRLLRAAYSVGQDAPLKVLLAQDHSADARRMLTWHGYVQRQRAERIAALGAEIASLDTLEQDIARTRERLQHERAEQQQQVARLQRDREARAAAVAQLEARYADRQARERALGSDARALEQVLAQLRAAARRAEAERRAAAERAAREARQAAAAESSGRAAGRSGSRSTGAGRSSSASAARAAAAAATGPRVGGLGWPLSGQLLAGFGANLPDGRRSSGLLIAAPAGTRVNAVADGQVVFAEWMTGYGLIIIVDHGGGTLSLYAHNDALLQDVGTRVRRGDPVSSVGSSGGQGRPALYFELRRNGQPVNPQGWLASQR